MNHRTTTCSAYCLAALMTFTLTGCHASPKEKKAPRFLSADSIRIADLLPDPPEAGSLENEQEYAVLGNVAKMSDADKQRIEREIKLDVFDFDDVLGKWFSAENCHKTARLFDEVGEEARFFSNKGKEKFQRRRPTTRSGFTPFSSEPSTSYPSGHSTRAMCWAEILADVFPDQRDKLVSRGRQIGFDRALAGVHYPSDIYGGRVVGHVVARKLLKNPSFRAQLSLVKAELIAAKERSGS